MCEKCRNEILQVKWFRETTRVSPDKLSDIPRITCGNHFGNVRFRVTKVCQLYNKRKKLKF